jgi:DNA-3-methyladenine glycosylase I
VGPVIVYAWTQATGIVDDHGPDCFRHGKVR